MPPFARSAAAIHRFRETRRPLPAQRAAPGGLQGNTKPASEAFATGGNPGRSWDEASEVSFALDSDMVPARPLAAASHALRILLLPRTLRRRQKFVHACPRGTQLKPLAVTASRCRRRSLRRGTRRKGRHEVLPLSRGRRRRGHIAGNDLSMLPRGRKTGPVKLSGDTAKHSRATFAFAWVLRRAWSAEGRRPCARYS